MTTTLQQAEAARRIIDQAAQLDTLRQQQRDAEAAEAARLAAALTEARATFAANAKAHHAAKDYRDQVIGNLLIAMRDAQAAIDETHQTESALIEAADQFATLQASAAGQWKLAPRSVAEAHRNREANMATLARYKAKELAAAGFDPNHPTPGYPFGNSDAARAVLKALS